MKVKIAVLSFALFLSTVAPVTSLVSSVAKADPTSPALQRTFQILGRGLNGVSQDGLPCSIKLAPNQNGLILGIPVVADYEMTATLKAGPSTLGFYFIAGSLIAQTQTGLRVKTPLSFENEDEETGRDKGRVDASMYLTFTPRGNGTIVTILNGPKLSCFFTK